VVVNDHATYSEPGQLGRAYPIPNSFPQIPSDNLTLVLSIPSTPSHLAIPQFLAVFWRLSGVYYLTRGSTPLSFRTCAVCTCIRFSYCFIIHMFRERDID